jgi:orotidine-5'-phosphate decarboxylase
MKERIIVALDTDSPERALETVASLRGEVGLFKVGMELFPRGGPDLVRRIRDAGAEVFLDLKFHDIPNTVAGAVRSAAALGVRFATVHASGGKAMLAAAARAAEGTGATLLAVTVLTSLDSGDLAEIGFSGTAVESVLRLAGLASGEGIGGIVCSAQEVSAVRQRVGGGAVLVTPGVRLPEDAAGDQKRVVTPEDAVRRGADFIVVGRPITKAPDPVDAARRFAAAMGRAAGPGVP